MRKETVTKVIPQASETIPRIAETMVVTQTTILTEKLIITPTEEPTTILTEVGIIITITVIAELIIRIPKISDAERPFTTGRRRNPSKSANAAKL